MCLPSRSVAAIPYGLANEARCRFPSDRTWLGEDKCRNYRTATPAPLGLLLRNPQPLMPPYPLRIHMPAMRTKERCNTPVAIKTTLGCESNDLPRHGILPEWGQIATR